MEKERRKKKQSTGAVFRDLYAIPLSSFCPSLLPYNVCISCIEQSITLPLGTSSISGEQSEYRHHTNTILDLNQAATAMQRVSTSNENRPCDLHISRAIILKCYIAAECIQFLIMTSKQVL